VLLFAVECCWMLLLLLSSMFEVVHHWVLLVTHRINIVREVHQRLGHQPSSSLNDAVATASTHSTKLLPSKHGPVHLHRCWINWSLLPWHFLAERLTHSKLQYVGTYETKRNMWLHVPLMAATIV